MSDQSEDINVSGQDKVTGRFVKGNTLGKGRPKGSRNKLTQQMLNLFASRQEVGMTPMDIMIDIYTNPDLDWELRFKAAGKAMDMVYPKASSVEVKMDDEGARTKDDIDNRLREILSKGLSLNK